MKDYVLATKAPRHEVFLYGDRSI